MLGNQRTYAYSTFVISLRHRVDEHNLLLDVGQMECRDVRSPRVAELAIHFIGEEEQVVFLDQIPYLKHLFHRIEIARGVVGVAYKDALGLGSYQLLKFFNRRQCKSFVDARRHSDNLSAGRNCKRHVVGIGKKHSLGTACSDDYVVDFNINVISSVILLQLFTQRQ